MENHGTRTDFGVGTNCERTKNFCAAGDYYVVTDSRMAFASFFTGTAECNALVKGDVGADFSGFTNYNTHAMIDKEAAA